MPGAGTTFQVSVALPAAGKVEDTTPSNAAAPDLAGTDVMLVAPTATAASLVARRLMRWGARTCLVPEAPVATALLPERAWSAILVDYALGAAACEQLAKAANKSASNIARRIVLIAPAERHALPALKDAGFTGYLVKPVRAASLAARMTTAQGHFEHDAERSIGTPADAAEVAHAPHELAILVAEDNEINALLAQALLARLGHRPTLVATGDAAVEAWRAAQAGGPRFDLVLMDLHMPGSDGLAATRRIRALEADHGAARTPIIALTANALEEDRQACLAAGMDGFLTKPLDRERLAAALKSVVTKRMAA
jgi:CheY-like chemotaxis protein